MARTSLLALVLGILSLNACGLTERVRHPERTDPCVGVVCGEAQGCELRDGEPVCVCVAGFVLCDSVCLAEDVACEPPTESVCVEGDTRCEDGWTVAVCDATGQWTLTVCPADTNGCEDGGCVPRVCVPLERVCVGWEVHQCAADGMSWEFLEICAGECDGGVCLDPCGHHTDKVSYLGCTFWAVNLENFNQEAQDDFAVTVSSDAHLPIEVVVTTAQGLELERVEIEPGSLITLPLTTLGQLDATGITDQSYLIESTGRVTVHQFNPMNTIDIHSSDASLLLPLEALGTEYRVMGWPTELVYINVSLPCTVDEDCLFPEQVCVEEECVGPAMVGKGQVSIVGTSVEAPTLVTIESPVDLEIGDSSGATVTYPAGEAQGFSLERGQVLTVATTAVANADLTGMTISADHEVAVFSGSTCSMIPHGTFACDHLEQQLFPTAVWGSEYVGAKFSPRGEEPDIWRVLATEDGTSLSTSPALDAVDGAMLDAGEVLQFESTSSFELRASQPISVAQYMVGADYPGPAGGCASDGLFPAPASDRSSCAIETAESCGGHQAIGDPAFLMNVPTSQFRTRYVVLVPGDYLENYLSFIMSDDAEIALNGIQLEVSPQQIEGSSWSVFTKEVAPGVHVVEANEPVGLNTYGYDCTVSYAYPGGLNLEALEH